MEGKWYPYNADDVQMAFTMLEPYYQVLLKRIETKGTPEYEQKATYTHGFRTP